MLDDIVIVGGLVPSLLVDQETFHKLPSGPAPLPGPEVVTYVHADPDRAKTYYWVVACNSGGCSNFDSDNPPIALETISTGPTNTATHIATQTPTPPNTPLPVSLPAIPTRPDMGEDKRYDRINSPYLLDRSPDSSGRRRRPERL